VSRVDAPAAFVEGYVEADGFRIRYLEGGSGPPLVVLHSAGGLRLGRAHELLAARRRLIAFEAPGFGSSPVNERTQSMRELAHTLRQAIAALGMERYVLMGSSFGGRLAAWLALAAGEQVEALVLTAPAAILGDLPPPAVGTPEEMAALLYAHPERQPQAPLDPAVIEKHQALVRRILGPARDPQLEAGLAALQVPTLVLFGTEDRLTPPELGRIYSGLLPRCHVVLVYDAGHEIEQERPEAFAGLVGDFLERKLGFVTSAGSSLINP
jgi:pimeloyl-ACP methyl ester carboxylesterase